MVGAGGPAVARYRVVVDEKSCIGTSQCTEIGRKAYRMNEDGTMPIPIPGAPDDEVLAGAQSCPVMAITVFEVATGAQVWPRPT
jgi:ferredoxin